MLDNEVKTWEPIIPPKKENITSILHLLLCSLKISPIILVMVFTISPHQEMFSFCMYVLDILFGFAC